MNMEVWFLYLHRFVEDVDDEMKNVKNTIGHYHAHILMCNMRNHTTYTHAHTGYGHDQKYFKKAYWHDNDVKTFIQNR